MRLELVADLLTLYVDQLDVSIAATDGHLLARLVELTDVSDSITCVDVEDFLHHTDIPNLDDTVRVTGRNVLPTNGEAAVVDRVQVTEESLDGQASTHIPDRDTAVGGTRHEEVCKGLEV